MLTHIRRISHHNKIKYHHHTLHNGKDENICPFNAAIKIKHDFSHLHTIPSDLHEKIFELLPHYCFTVQHLEKLNHMSLELRVFVKYFNHIPLYQLKDADDKLIMDVNVLTWDPEKALKQYHKTCKSIYRVYLHQECIINVENTNHAKSNVIILPTLFSIYMTVSDYRISHQNLLNTLHF